MQYIRRNDWREAAEKPLNRQFCAAAGSADAAELAQLQRMAPVCPPPPFPPYRCCSCNKNHNAKSQGSKNAEKREKQVRAGFLANLTYLIDGFGEFGGVSAAWSGKAAGIVRDMSDAKIDIQNLLPRKNKEVKQRHLTQRLQDSEAQR